MRATHNRSIQPINSAAKDGGVGVHPMMFAKKYPQLCLMEAAGIGTSDPISVG